MADSAAARPTLGQLGWEEYPRPETVFADGGYQGSLEDWTADQLGLWLVVVPKLAGQSTLVPLPKRWIVERTLARLLKCRRLVRDYEALPCSSEAWIRCSCCAARTRIERFLNTL